MHYLEGYGDLVSKLMDKKIETAIIQGLGFRGLSKQVIMVIIGVIMWLIGVINLLTKSP